MMHNRHDACQYNHVPEGHIDQNKKEEMGGARRVEQLSPARKRVFIIMALVECTYVCRCCLVHTMLSIESKQGSDRRR